MQSEVQNSMVKPISLLIDNSIVIPEDHFLKYLYYTKPTL